MVTKVITSAKLNWGFALKKYFCNICKQPVAKDVDK
jgi:hypothetical protein